MDVEPGLGEMTASAAEPPVPGRERLSLGYALTALVAAFLLAQLFGKLAGDIARSITHTGQGELTVASVVPALLATETTLVLVSLIVPLMASLPLRATLGLQRTQPAIVLAAALGTVSLGALGDQLMTLFSEFFPSLTLGVVPALHDLAQRLPWIWLWPAFALFPGLAEELLFRGVLQRSIQRPRLAIAVSGCAFAAFHVDPVHVIGVLPLGLFLAWAAARSCTTVTIGAHVINNSVAVLAIKNAELDVGFGSEQALPPAFLVGSLLVFAASAFALHQLTRPAAAADHGTG